ncbi:MAG: helix-turn-helix domain-containing protein [Lachnospiraceae bacterium]
MRYIEYHERKTHGTLDFPFAFYHVNQHHPRYMMPYHWHSEAELIYILSGEFTVLLDKKEYPLHQGDYLYVPSGTLHGGTPQNCCYECLVFNMESLINETPFAKACLQPFLQNQIEIVNYIPAQSASLCGTLRPLFDEMREKSEGYQLKVLGNFYQFLGNIFTQNYYHPIKPESQTAQKRTQQYKQILTYIGQNYSEDITLEDLAACVHLNSRYFCRMFRELTHQSPIEYLNTYRIEAACEQLSYTDKTITEIAFDCGYHDVGYFIKVFKKIKGLTPTQYLHKKYTTSK